VRAQDRRTWSVTKRRVVLHSFILFVRLVSPARPLPFDYFLTIAAYAESKGGGEMAGFGEVLEQYHRTLAAFIQGDPEPTLRLWSKRDDVTLANPFGPPVRGWNAVRETSEHPASQVTDGEAFSVEGISTYATADLAYALEIHRFRASVVLTKLARSSSRNDHLPTRG
jgi:hypothetical protein